MEFYRHLYFLYVWQEPHTDPTMPPDWRYRAEDARTHEQYLFTEPAALLKFLELEEKNSSRRKMGPCVTSSGEEK